MKIFKKKTNMLIVAMLLTASLFLIQSTGLNAQDCSTYEDQNQGNLLGYILASNLPTDSDGHGNKIYVSSFDDIWTSGETYDVSYDRDTNLFSGRGYNRHIGFVDFDYGTSDQAYAPDAANNSYGWGDFGAYIFGLDELSYSNNAEQFLLSGDEDGNGVIDGSETGSGVYNSEYVSGQADGDAPVGLGQLDFSNVDIDTSGVFVPIECQEIVNLSVNGSPEAHINTCGGTVDLTWSISDQIESGSCVAVSNSAPWINPGSRSNTNILGETSGAINDTVNFIFECEGSVSGNTIRDTAKVTCGSTSGGGGSSNTEGQFEFIES
mgnify:CR=1 FL=1